MITNNSTKYEYKAVLLPSAKENPADTARLAELCDTLNKAGLEYWEPFDLAKHLPGGYILLKRSLGAPSTAPKRSIFSSVPKVTVAAAVAASPAKVIAPALVPALTK